MKLEKLKEYRTRSGDKAIIVEILDADYKPYTGVILRNRGVLVRAWDSVGNTESKFVSPDDIVGEWLEPKPLVNTEAWLVDGLDFGNKQDSYSFVRYFPPGYRPRTCDIHRYHRMEHLDIKVSK